MAGRSFNREQMTERIEQLLGGIVRLAGFQLTFTVRRTAGEFQREYENPELLVAFEGPDTDLLLANKAELLQSLEHLVLEALRVPNDHREQIFFDSHDYRMMRVDELTLAAQTAAERVRRTGVAFSFSPMSSRERRVIHMALRGEAGVRSESEGVGQFRKVIVHPSEPAARPPSKPHPPSR